MYEYLSGEVNLSKISNDWIAELIQLLKVGNLLF